MATLQTDPMQSGFPTPKPVPEVSILLLGDPGTGKHTFLSALTSIRPHTSASPPRPTPSNQSPPLPPSRSQPPWPLTFSISLYNRPYHFHIYPNTTSLFTDPFPPHPQMVILTYSIPQRHTLLNARNYWSKAFQMHYPQLEGRVPVMLLGLMRDLRTDARLPDTEGLSANGEVSQYECVMPDEGLRVAQEIRADAYAECSAVTGELFWEVMEDITKMAAKTTTPSGWQGRESCLVM